MNESGVWTLVGVGVGVVGVTALAMYLSRRDRGGARVDLEHPEERDLLIAKGNRVAFEFTNGQRFELPSSMTMLHDESGKWWPKCSVLFGRFQPGVADDAIRMDQTALDYLGRGYQAHKGLIDTPPKSLSSWTRIENVKRIWYTRTGKRAPGKYHHGFGRKTLPFDKDASVVLYRYGRFFRLELPKQCVVNWRGYVYP